MCQKRPGGIGQIERARPWRLPATFATRRRQCWAAVWSPLTTSTTLGWLEN